MRIIAYTYLADVHCPLCTRADYEHGFFQVGVRTLSAPEFDEHGLPELMDSDGNAVAPVFSTDERECTHCGDCGDEL